jgi:excisionase family DNA binding protein
MKNLELRTVAEAAGQLRLSDGAIYDLCRRGRLPHLRLGRGRGAIRIAQTDIDGYLERCFVGEVGGERGLIDSEPVPGRND